MLLAFLLLPLFWVTPRTVVAKPSDSIEYHLEVDLHPAEQSLSAKATLLLPPMQAPFVVQLAAQADITSIEIDKAPAAFVFRNGTLSLPALPATIDKPTRLDIRYRARFADPLPTETIGIEDPSFGVGAAIRDEGTYLSAGTPWFPQLAGARGRHRVTVSAPAGITAVTAGRLVDIVARDDRTLTVWDNTFPLEGLALAAGRYELARDDLDGIQLLTFLSPGNATLAPGYLAAMRRHLAFYRELLGPYPFAKFAVVENFLPTGYGMPSWTLLGRSVVRLPFLLDTSLPHEIVHSWWGNAIEVDYARGNWAEGLATYLADYLLKERTDPAEALDYRRKLLRDYATLVTAAEDFPLRSFSGRMSKLQQAVGYGKGAMVFHMLRKTIGDAAFWMTLRRMAAEGNGRELGWDDIERISGETTGTDLRWFFAQWVERKEAPALVLDDVRSIRSTGGWTVSGLVRQSGQNYRLALPLTLTMSNSETLQQTVAVTGARTPFSFTATSEPLTLEADPDSHLFRRLDEAELPATVNDLLDPRRPLVMMAEGQHDLRQAARDLLKGLHWEEAEFIDEAAATPHQLAGRDLLHFGWPRRTELQPALPGSLAVSSRNGTVAWAVDGRQAEGDALFAVLAGRHSRDGARALLLAKSPDAVRPAAAKISHYGRYSMLLFAAGRNVVKSTWQTEISPLKVHFPKETQP